VLRKIAFVALLVLFSAASTASANHIPGHPCANCVSHANWPTITGTIQKAKFVSQTFYGTWLSDELLGHHGSDRLYGLADSDVLWGDWQGGVQPTSQRDRIYGGDGNDFIYGSHGRNVIYGGAGNDAISVHFGRGFVDCGAGNDIYHVTVSKARRGTYKFRDCEQVDHRSEAQRGGGLRPLP
jgi:hypothetical protein